MPSKFPTPDRCLLEQAAHWYIGETLPLPDEIYLRAPIELNAQQSELRDLFLALLAEDCDVRGDLQVEFRCAYHDNKLDPPVPPFDLAQDAKISMEEWSLRSVYFGQNAIGSVLRIPIEHAKSQYEKLRQDFPKDQGWAAIFRFVHVSLDFSKLRTALSRSSESKNIPAKRGAPAKYKWDAIWAELVVLAELDGIPSKQAECIDQISLWCIDQFGDAPSETLFKEKLKLIYRHSRMVGK